MRYGEHLTHPTESDKGLRDLLLNKIPVFTWCGFDAPLSKTIRFYLIRDPQTFKGGFQRQGMAGGQLLRWVAEQARSRLFA
jgi:hypothetical protein